MKAKTREVRGKLKNAILSLSETQLTQFTRTLFLRYGDLDFVDMEEERSIAQSLSFQIEGDDDYLEWVIIIGRQTQRSDRKQ